MWVRSTCGHGLEQLAGEVVRGAVARRAVVQLARVRLGEGDQVLQVLELVRMLRVDHHHVRHVGEHRHRHEVLLERVGQLGIQALGDGVVHRAEEEGVSVARPLGGVGGAHRAACAGEVLDDELLPHVLAQHDRQRPAEGVDAAAGGERVDQRHRLGRPALRVHARGQRREQRECDFQNAFHGLLLSSVVIRCGCLPT
jgi:hypothetical protein